jgi:PAS domain S-box-containing protein
MFQALRNHKAGHMVVSFHDSNGDLLTVVVTVDVITRPKGYFIIRGRDYVEKRADSADSENGNKNVLKLLRDAVGHMEGGVVIADHTGKIIAINKAFEQWLGYDAGEVLQSRVPLGQIFHQYVRYDTGILLLSDFEGQVIIKRKSRVTVTAKVHQKLFADAERTYGISAAIDLQHTV